MFSPQEPTRLRNKDRETAAQFAARQVRDELEIPDCNNLTGLVLGTGLGEIMESLLGDKRKMPLNKINGFEGLSKLPGHKRELVFGYLREKPVLVQNGRIHLNEKPYVEHLFAVRLQIELMAKLPIQHLILTCAAGSLPLPKNFFLKLAFRLFRKQEYPVGDIVAIDKIVTLFAPNLPLFAGEFIPPQDTIDKNLIGKAYMPFLESKYKDGAIQETPFDLHTGTFAMVRGPHFETFLDKMLLRLSGADIVGMSMIPEIAIAALYDVPVLPFAFITNNATEKHSHETNTTRAQKAAAAFGNYLAKIISYL